MQLEVSEIGVEQLGDGSWWAKVSARMRGRDLGPRSQEFRASNHILLFEEISNWFNGFIAPTVALPVKKGRKHG